MKKKKQRKKLIQGLGISLLSVLSVLGIWSLSHSIPIQAKTVKTSVSDSIGWTNPPENEQYYFGAGPLGSGGPNSIWQNTLGTDDINMIPKEYAFSLLPSEKTESFVPEESQDLVQEYVPNHIVRFYPPVNEWASVVFTNMGYYQGKNINLKISFQVENELPENQQPNDGALNRFSISTNKSSEQFLTVTSGSLSGNATIKYEFLDDTNQPISLSSYFSLRGMGNTMTYLLPMNIPQKIYSTDINSSFPVTLKYAMLASDLWFTGTEVWNTTSPLIKRSFTTTFTESAMVISYGKADIFKPAAGANYALSYSGTTYVKIEFPNPQGIDPSFDRIDEVTEKKVNYQFVQQVPYEGKFEEFGINNRDQTLKWTITSPIANKTVRADDWEVVDETGKDRTDSDWFTFTDVDENKAEVIPNDTEVGNNASNGVAPSLDDFYNHYYTFKRKLTIDYTKPIDEKLLKDRDGGKYLDKTGTVTLAVNGVPREEQTFKTSINFAAPIEYKIIDSVTNQPISQTVVQSEYINNNGLVTWLAPLPNKEPPNVIDNPDAYYTAENAPVIPGYQFKSAKLNGQSENMQVKYTKLLDATSDDYTQNNVVTLEYQPLYTVDVQVGALDTDGNFGTIPFAPLAPPSGTSESYVTVTEKAAPQVSKNGIQTGKDADFTFGDYPFDVGTKSYQVQQVAPVNEKYDMPDGGITIDFSINSTSQLVVGTEVVTTKEGEIFVYKDPTKPYILRWDPANKKLVIQMINFPQGEVEIEGEEIKGEYRVDDIDFGNVTIPAQADIVQVPETKEDGKFPTLVVVDTRLPAYRKDGWRLSVYMSKAFTAVGGTDKIDGILYYKSQSLGSTPIPFDEGTTPVSIEVLTPEAGTAEETDPVWSTPIALGSAAVAQDGLPAEGFYLNIKKPTQLGIKAGEYQAELTFSVENSAFTTPTGRSK